jgi:hypothetical protein
MPPKQPPSVERHGDGPRALRPPYTYSVPITKQPWQCRHVRPPHIGQTACRQHSIDTHGAGYHRHYICLQEAHFLSKQNIERTCFTALGACVNDAFKVSNDPPILGWHAGMHVINILDQLSKIYSQPMPAVLEMNDAISCSPYSATDAPEVLFQQIE